MGNRNAEQIAERALRARRIPRGRLQYGALCYRRTRKGRLRILLITTRRTKRWMSPKGWPMKGKDGPATAAQEAWEEAGARGRVSSHTLGFYHYEKQLSRNKTITCLVQVFPMEVRIRKKKFPEDSERRAKWMKPAKAARKVADTELARLIRELAEHLETQERRAPQADAEATPRKRAAAKG